MMQLDELKEGKVLLIDKPLEWTSFDVVNKIRYAILKKHKIKKFKVGHAGTLDPLATGLLIICVGKATKTINNYQGMDKEYTGVFTLGATTPSYDMETPVDKQFSIDHIDEDMINKVAKSFIGKQMQTPPVFSAIKKDGKKMYEHARKGQKVEMKQRPVEIKEFEITNINLPEIHFRVLVSKGTYIRSLAYDFGQKLQSGAYLSELRRTKIGDFHVKEAITHTKWIEENVR
jgi:tRNA pseudouridine55 synthase